MSFKVVGEQLKYTGTIEESIVEALIKYPGLKALVVTEKKNAVDAAISFYVRVNMELKSKYLTDVEGISTEYSNGSQLTFIGNSNLTDGKYKSVESHILLAYGNISDWQLTKLIGASVSYDKKNAKLFPIVFTEAYQVFGEEAAHLAADFKKEYEENFTAGRQGRKKTKK